MRRCVCVRRGEPPPNDPGRGTTRTFNDASARSVRRSTSSSSSCKTPIACFASPPRRCASASASAARSWAIARDREPASRASETTRCSLRNASSVRCASVATFFASERLRKFAFFSTLQLSASVNSCDSSAAMHATLSASSPATLAIAREDSTSAAATASLCFVCSCSPRCNASLAFLIAPTAWTRFCAATFDSFVVVRRASLSSRRNCVFSCLSCESASRLCVCVCVCGGGGGGGGGRSRSRNV